MAFSSSDVLTIDPSRYQFALWRWEGYDLCTGICFGTPQSAFAAPQVVTTVTGYGAFHRTPNVITT